MLVPIHIISTIVIPEGNNYQLIIRATINRELVCLLRTGDAISGIIEIPIKIHEISMENFKAMLVKRYAAILNAQDEECLDFHISVRLAIFVQLINARDFVTPYAGVLYTQQEYTFENIKIGSQHVAHVQNELLDKEMLEFLESIDFDQVSSPSFKA